jgi:hypothetical protein
MPQRFFSWFIVCHSAGQLGQSRRLLQRKDRARDDADVPMAKDAEPVLRQVLTVTPGVQEFVKNITKKHLQR